MTRVDAHLTADAFVDLVEGAVPETEFPHLADCRACRDQLADVRAAMQAADAADVPEPPPFFWSTLVSRVNARIDADGTTRSWLGGITASVAGRVAFAAATLCVVAVAAMLSGRRQQAIVAPSRQDSTTAVTARQDAVDVAADPMLNLVAELSDTMDLESRLDAAALADSDAAEQAVVGMSHDELRALEGVLKDALAGKGV